MFRPSFGPQGEGSKAGKTKPASRRVADELPPRSKTAVGVSSADRLATAIPGDSIPFELYSHASRSFSPIKSPAMHMVPKG